MKPYLFDAILFYCCFNLAAGLVAQMNIVNTAYPSWQPFSSLQGMFTGTISNILGNWTSPTGLTAIVSGITAIVGILIGNFMIAFGFLTLMGIAIIAPFILNIVGGLPQMLIFFGVPQTIIDPLTFVFAFIACMFIIEMISQRDWS